MEEGNGPGGQQHGDQRSGAARKPTLQRDQQDQNRRRHGQRGQRDLIQTADEGSEPRSHGVSLDIDACDLSELADDHQNRDADHVAGQHRSGEQVGQEAEPGDPADHTDRADRQRERGGSIGMACGPVRHQRSYCGRGHQGCTRLWSDGKLPRGSEHRVDGERADDRPESGDCWQAGDLCVGHHLGNEIRRDCYAGQHIAA